MPARQKENPELVVKYWLDNSKEDLKSAKVMAAQKRAKKDSDIDLAIISDSFKGIDYFERLVILGKLAWQTKATAIEALGFTLEEYKNASKLDFLGEIKKKGITLFEQRRKKNEILRKALPERPR
jgi:predicted nucleotidyltransferase